MKKGDYVEVKQGIKDPEYLKYDFSGFRGIVVDVSKADNETLISIDWDIKTLTRIPKEYIAISIEQGYGIDNMNLFESELTLLSEKCTDDSQEKQNLLHQLEDEADLINTPYGKILGKNLKVNEKTLTKYRTYLSSKFSMPFVVTGREDFQWEEKYFFGYGSNGEYEAMKKTNPSYTDTYEVLKIYSAKKHPHDLMVKVKRISDKKLFELGLSWLEATEKKTDNYKLLEDFATWVVNYQ